MSYCRVSTDRQTKNLSLEAKRDCAASGANAELSESTGFVDPGVSAKTLERKALQDLLAYCKANQRRIHYVLSYDVSRFSREPSDYYTVKARLQPMGIEFKSVLQEFDDSPAGVLIESVFVGKRHQRIEHVRSNARKA